MNTTELAPSAGREETSVRKVVDHLVAFDGSPEAFLQTLVQAQCRISGASAGAILRVQRDAPPEPRAVDPPLEDGQAHPSWLARAIDLADRPLRSNRPEVVRLRKPHELYGARPSGHLALVPVRTGKRRRAVGAFLLADLGERALADARMRLELTASFLTLYEMRLTCRQRETTLRQLRHAAEVLAAVNGHDRANAACMALCNEVAARFGAERVSLGFLRGRYVKAAALSHTEKLTRHMRLVQDLEAAMEEALDQDTDVLYPPPAEAVCVSRAAGELSTRHGPSAVAALPLRRDGEPESVLLLERSREKPLGSEALQTLRQCTDLVAPRLFYLRETDRWLGAKVATKTRAALATVVGDRQTWAKAASLATAAAIAFLVFAEGTYKVEAAFTVEASGRRVVPAPFAGTLKEALVSPGDPVASGKALSVARAHPAGTRRVTVRADGRSPGVEAGHTVSFGEEGRTYTVAAENLPADGRGTIEVRPPLATALSGGEGVRTVLATLSTEELHLRLDRAQAELRRHRKTAALARRKERDAAAEVASAKADRVRARIDLLAHRVARATITAPVTGHVLAGELKKKEGAPLKKGEILYELAPLDTLEATLSVPESRALDVYRVLGKRQRIDGRLAAAPRPGSYIPFTIRKITPSATVENQRNVFPARATLHGTPGWLRPGMEGVAKIHAGEASYAWIWAYPLVDWLRMKLWL